MTTNLYQKKKDGKIMCWSIRQNNEELITTWGFLGTQNLQEDRYVSSGSGTPGTLLFQTPEKSAKAEMERRIKSKKNDGFKDSIEEAKLAENICEYKSIFENLEKCFAPPKPVNNKPCKKNSPNTPNEYIQELENHGHLWSQIKRNGIRAFYIKTNKNSKLMSRKMKDMGDNFLPIKQKLDSLNVPDYTILDMEIVVGEGLNNKEFRTVSSMAPNSFPETAKNIYSKWVKEYPNKPLKSFCFDVIFFEEKRTIGLPYVDRHKILENLLFKEQKEYMDRGENNTETLICYVENYSNFKEAFNIAQEKNAEGLVLWDKRMQSDFTMDGKPYRPPGCWKFKNSKSDDFFILDFESQKGDSSKVGSLIIAQFDEKGNIIRRGKVGTGLSHKQRSEAWGWRNKVIEVIYDDEHPKNNAGEICLQFPKFYHMREDKKREECIYYE